MTLSNPIALALLSLSLFWAAFAGNQNAPLARAGVSPSGSAVDFVDSIVVPNEGWVVIASGFKDPRGVATDCLGHPYFADASESKVFCFNEEGRVEPFIEESGKAYGQAFGPDGLLYSAARGQKKIVAYKIDGTMNVVADGLDAFDLVVTDKGMIYALEGPSESGGSSRLWFIPPGGPAVILDETISQGGGLAVSPDKSTLYVAAGGDGLIYAFNIGAAGELSEKRTVFQFGKDVTSGKFGSEHPIPLRTDVEGRIYAGTSEGIQIVGADGRELGVLSVPGRRIASFDFGGERRDVLFVAAGDRILKRRLAVRGVSAFLSGLFWPRPQPGESVGSGK